jgi:hypothetical protein
MIEIGSAAPILRGALTIIRYHVNRLYCNMFHTIESYCIAGLAHWVCPSCFGVSILHESNEGWRERSGTTLVRQPMARATPAPKAPQWRTARTWSHRCSRIDCCRIACAEVISRASAQTID